MRTWARWTARTVMVTTSFAAAGAGMLGVANASTHITSGDNSILGGNQINAPVSVPVDVCGNALAILGDAFGACQGGAAVLGGSGHGTWITSGDNSIGGGNQINAPISVPVDVCGNAAAVLGTALAHCKGGAVVDHTSAPGWGPGNVHITSGDNSIGGGNQANVPVSVPVNICGNAAAVLGTALAGCKGGAAVIHTDGADGGGWGGGWGGPGNIWITSGDNSILGGIQINAPISVPEIGRAHV